MKKRLKLIPKTKLLDIEKGKIKLKPALYIHTMDKRKDLSKAGKKGAKIKKLMRCK